MKLKLWIKVVIFIFLIAIIVFFGLIGFVLLLFSPHNKFYIPIGIVFSFSLISYLFLLIFGLFKAKFLSIIYCSFVIVLISIVIIFNFRINYEKSIPVVNDQGVDLREYEPFTENTKAVKLNEESSLKIKDEPPLLDGATALYPLYSAFVQAVYPEKQYPVYTSTVICSNTINAFNNLLAGKADIIFTAKPSRDQIEKAKVHGIEYSLTPIGREAFVFFVNSKNPVDALSKNDIQNIYSGIITNWKQVGGLDEKIKAFQRPENSGSQTMLQKLMEEKKLIDPLKEDVVGGMGGIISQTANYKNYKNAIGYSFLFFATKMVKNNQIKLVTVDGIMPDKSTIKNKTYPLTAEFYAITSGSKNPNIKRFIEWICSPQGQSLVEKTGYTPIK